VRKAISVYRNGNILARSIIGMPALGDAAGNIRIDAPRFPGQQGKEDYMLVINGSLVVRKATNGGSM
jgi:hypothetical protein